MTRSLFTLPAGARDPRLYVLALTPAQEPTYEIRLRYEAPIPPGQQASLAESCGRPCLDAAPYLYATDHVFAVAEDQARLLGIAFHRTHVRPTDFVPSTAERAQ